MDAVIKCTGRLTSAATRNTALRLLSKLASLRPKETLENTLQVVAAVAESAQQQDNQSLQIAADTLRAVAPAWIDAGRGLPQLVEAALAVVEGLSLHRSILLLSALISALPQEAGLQSLLVSALERASLGNGASAQWIEIAGLLCKQVEWPMRVAAFRGLLEETLKSSRGHPEEGVASLATALVVGELGESRVESGAEGPEHSDNLQAILQNALQRLQVLGSHMAGALSRRQNAAVGAITKLLKALEEVMPRQQYLAALMALLASPEEAIVTRALRLFQSCLAAPAETHAGAAAMHFCDQVGVILGGKSSAKVKQNALVALGSLATAHGKDDPAKVLGTIPAILTQVLDSSWALRASALATLAAVLNALGPAVIPLLPRLVPPVLSAAVAAAEQLPEVEDEDTEMEDAVGWSSDDEERPSDASVPRASERQQLEVQAALGAVRALIDNLGPFLSPHLPSILHLLLDPRLLHPQSPACPLAADARGRLCGAVPARLLLPALIQHLDSATQEGAASVRELLHLTGHLVDTLDTAAAATSGDAVWAFALRVLAFRQDSPPGLGSVKPLEEAALKLVMSLTLKLTEGRFKPMFLRLVDWAATPPSSGVAGPERQIVLFKLVNALAEQLRAVFVPYFRHLLGLVTTHLASSSGGKRKREHVPKPSSAEAYAGPDAPFLRLQVVQALHKCLLFDQGGFLDQPLFNRLLTPLTAQLSFHFPPEVATRELDPVQLPGGVAAAEGLDVFGRAAVEAVVQMAVSVRAEAMWKPLHHQVLMSTRSDDPVERRRALEVVLQLVGRLGEEYVMLLPEAMPFLAELLEDPELHIQNGTRELLRKLEEITGENFDEYLKM